ncbi:hypothetical protein [Pulveribacter suum]|uniref:Polysaccharide lyase n=1 Tax=Pulveribacter suum TaxID=2116657 RepID=A0A2P1NPA9_9BURK|nr:hypothetical protein [Pulveribacter suum]AVP58843.1 hypothetical protein C7H73_14980 [Pulveribacter suum]
MLWASLALTSHSSTPAAAPSVATPSKVVFVREIQPDGKAADYVRETYPWGTQTLPAHRIAKPGHGFLHHTFATEKPAQATTQVLTFRFRSNDLFATNPGAHFLVSGRSESTSWYNRGRGFIVGDLSRTVNPCPGAMASQPESWWTLQPQSQAPASTVWNGHHCGPSLRDGVWYDVHLHVNSDNHFAYWIWQDGQLITSQLVHDTRNPEGALINDKLTGFAFGLVFARNYSSPWTLEFDRITVRWL